MSKDTPSVTSKMAVPCEHADQRAFNDRQRQKLSGLPDLEHVDTCQSDTKQYVVCEEVMPVPKQLNPDRAMRFVIRHAESVDCPNNSQSGASADDLTGRVTEEPPSESDEYYSLDERYVPNENYDDDPSGVKKLMKKRKSSSGKGCKPCENADLSSEDESAIVSGERPKRKKKRNGRSFSDHASQSEKSDTNIKTSYHEGHPTRINQEQVKHYLGDILKDGHFDDVANDSDNNDETNSDNFEKVANDASNCNKEGAEAAKDDVEVVDEPNKCLRIQDLSSNKIEAEDGQPQTMEEEDEQGCESSDLPRINADLILGTDVNVIKQPDSSAIRSSNQSPQTQMNHDEDPHTIEVARKDETAEPSNDVEVVDRPNREIKRRPAMRKLHTDEHDDSENRPCRKPPPGLQMRCGSCHLVGPEYAQDLRPEVHVENLSGWKQRGVEAGTSMLRNAISSSIKKILAEGLRLSSKSQFSLVSGHETSHVRSCQLLPASVKTGFKQETEVHAKLAKNTRGDEKTRCTRLLGWTEDISVKSPEHTMLGVLPWKRQIKISNHVKHQVRVNEPDEMFNNGLSHAPVDSAVENHRKNKRLVCPCAKRQDGAIVPHRRVDEWELGRSHQMVLQTNARKESEHSCKERNTGSFNDPEVEYLQTKKTKTSPLLTERQDIKVEWRKIGRVATVISSIGHEPQRKHRMKPSDLTIRKAYSQFRERRELYLQKMRAIGTEQLLEPILDFESKLMIDKTGQVQPLETASNQIVQSSTKSSATKGTKNAAKHQQEVSQNRRNASKRKFRIENISYNHDSESTNHRPKHGPAKKCRHDDSEYQSISDAFEKGQSSTLLHAQKRPEKNKIMSKPRKIRRYHVKRSSKLFHQFNQDGEKCDRNCHLPASHHHLDTPEIIQPLNKNSRSFRNYTEKAMHMPFRMVIWLSLLMGTTMEMARSSFGMVSAYHIRLCKGIQAVEECIPGILENLEKMSKPERRQWMEKFMAYIAARIAGKRSCKRGCSRKRKWKTTSDESFKAMLKRRRREVQRNIQTTEDDEGMIINEGYIQEQPEVQLMQPPTGKPSQPNYQDESQRVNSFRGCPELHRRARDLASSGFYLTTYNIVKCSSCQRQRHMRELGEDSSSWHFPTCRFRNARTSRRQGQTSHGPDVVAADTPGRVSDEIGDPPGQQSVYIPPGDVRNETYRLSTFEHFPVTCPISRKSLAKSGFYFTGFFDRVKCFACGRTVERWEARDNPAELRWHKPDCPFPRGDPCGNIPINDLFNRLHTNPMTRQQQAQQQQEQVLTQTDPNTGAVIRTVRYPTDLPERIRRTGGTFEIGPGNAVIIQSGPGSRPNPAIHIGNETAPPPPRRWRMANVVSADHRRFLSNLYLNRELDRLTSFARWPVSRPNVAPAALARTGFFYLGDMDRTQCFSCGGVLRNWTLEDDAQEEHRTHFPSCALVQGTENRNVAIPEEPESPEDRNRHYPCRYPANPHMRSEAARLETFDHRWPAGRVEASAALIAQAGFFFLGERDRVKCWYCNGGLQNWEYDDMPWIEHAKWFPNCQFLLQNQGQVFVYRHLAMNPHLARPIIAKQEGATVDPAGGEVARGQDIPPGPNVRQPSPPPTIIDPQEEMRKKKEKIENIMKTSDVCKNVIAMGFSVNVVRRLLEERVEAGTEANQEDIYESASALLDDVMKKEEEMQREAEEEEEARNQANLMSSMQSAYSTNLSSLGAASLGPAPGSGRYNVSFYDDDEPMDDEELYGSMNGPTSISSVTSASSVTAAKQVQQKDESQESLQEQLQKIEEERMCKICFSNTADMVFIPCSHMICCMDCTQAIRQCPVCRTKIEKAIKTYVN